MVKHQFSLRWFLLILVFTALSCGTPQVPEILGGPTQTPAPPTATPEGNIVEFRLAPYEVTLSPSENVPGTQIFFTGQEGDAYKVTLDGLPIEKYAVDSLNWTGIVAPGVAADYSMRVVPALNGNMTVAGLVDVAIIDAFPVAVSNGTTLSGPIVFRNIPQSYNIDVDQSIPGTTLFYLGQTPNGAQLGGTDNPYRLEGDALVWTGLLRSNVSVRYDLRVVSFSDSNLRLVGTAELYIDTTR